MSDASQSAVLLASGGLDSTTLAYWLRNNGTSFVPLFIDYGQHCAQTERERLADVLPAALFGQAVALNIRDIYRGCSSRLIKAPDLWTEAVVGDDLYLPYRNLLLLTVGAAYAQSRGASEVYAAFINSNHAKEIDCSAEFFDRLAGMLSDYGTVKIRMPFRDYPKRKVAEIGLALGAPIARTFSCQAASIVPCGACPNCVDRLQSLAELG
jgi:7-cyano-7-deazaguanine synthase